MTDGRFKSKNSLSILALDDLRRRHNRTSTLALQLAAGWEAELSHREELLAEWDRLDWSSKIDLILRSASAFWDALWMQPKRLEDEMFQDLRFGARMLLKNKGSAALAALTLALGIGANTTIFSSVIYGVLLKSLPYPKPDQLLVINEASMTNPHMTVSYLNLRDWQRQQTAFENITGYIPDSMILTGVGEPSRLLGKYVTANFFDTLGSQLALGRDFTEEEDRLGGEQVVILSNRVWQAYFNGDPHVFGRTIQLNGAVHKIVGVTSADFDFYGRQNLNNDLFLPIGQKEGLDYMRDRSAHPAIYAIGRLKPGVRIEQARAEMKALAARLDLEYPKENADHTIELRTFLDDYLGDIRRPLWIMQSAVVLVLLIACSNVANLTLARAVSRRREIAVRMALGAGRLRIARQLLTENLLLAAAGGALGIPLAVWGVRMLVIFNPDGLPRLDDVAVDWRVLGFTLLLSLLAGSISGLAPAVQTTKPDFQDALKEGWRSQSPSGGLRGALVVAEVALSLVLLIGAGLLLRSFWRVLRVDPGFNPDNVLTMRLRLPDTKYGTAKKMLAFYEETIHRVAALPGVRGASVTNGFILLAAINIAYAVEGQSSPQLDEEQQCIVQSVSPSYLRVFGVELLAGRDFTPQDNDKSQPVVIVDEDFARKHFPGGLPLSYVIGKHVLVGGDMMPWRVIIGVTRHVKHYGREEELGQPEIYRLWSQMGDGWVAKRMNFMDLAVKTSSDPLKFVAPIKREIQAIDKDQPFGNVRTMNSYLDESIGPRRLTLLLLVLFALMALLLGAAGIYGVTAYTVILRTHEIGIRLALGAQIGDALKLVIRQGMAPVFSGVAIGLAGAFALTRLIAKLLFNVSATDPASFISLPLLLVMVALLACWLPARRATRVDPLVALRQE